VATPEHDVAVLGFRGTVAGDQTSADAASRESRRPESCSGLVDLVVGVGRHGGGGHRLTPAGERFVGLVAEDTAQVGDRGGDLGDARRRRERTEREPGDGGRRFVASEPVEQSGENPRERVRLQQARQGGGRPVPRRR
jgi:hypothetical protein